MVSEARAIQAEDLGGGCPQVDGSPQGTSKEQREISRHGLGSRERLEVEMWQSHQG